MTLLGKFMNPKPVFTFPNQGTREYKNNGGYTGFVAEKSKHEERLKKWEQRQKHFGKKRRSRSRKGSKKRSSKRRGSKRKSLKQKRHQVRASKAMKMYQSGKVKSLKQAWKLV